MADYLYGVAIQANLFHNNVVADKRFGGLTNIHCN